MLSQKSMLRKACCCKQSYKQAEQMKIKCKLHSRSCIATMWNCYARWFKLRTMSGNATRNSKLQQSLQANFTAHDIVVHHISNAATPQIANSVRHFDSRFQPQKSRQSQRDNTHLSVSFTTNPPCQLPSNQLQILVDELFIAAIAIHLVAPNGHPLTLYKPTFVLR